MHREDQRQRLRDLAERADDAGEDGRVVHVGRAVHRHGAVARVLRLEVSAFERARVGALQLVDLEEQVVDHHVSDVVDGRLVLAFAEQVLDAGRFGREEHVRDGVGHEAVDLLGHRAVAAAQAGLDVRDGQLCLLRDDGAGERGVHVADDERHRGDVVRDALLVRHHDPGGLLGVRSAAGAHEHVGLRDAEFLEEDLVHVPVVVLAGVDDLEGHAARLHRPHDGGDLHEVGAGAGDQVDRIHRFSGLGRIR